MHSSGGKTTHAHFFGLIEITKNLIRFIFHALLNNELIGGLIAVTAFGRFEVNKSLNGVEKATFRRLKILDAAG